MTLLTSSTPNGASVTPGTREEVEGSLRFSSSLAAGLSILSCFSAERPVLSVAKLAEELQMTRSTTHRYASTLQALGYLEQDDARHYRLASRVADVGLSMLASMRLRQDAHEHLRGLRERTGRSVAMVVLDGFEVRYVDRLRGWRKGQHVIDERVGLGTRWPVHCSATGKVLLAHLPDAECERLLGGLELTKHGPKCITKLKALRAELARVRASRLAIGDEEAAAGLRSIASVVLDGDGLAVGAIAISVPSEAFTTAQLVEVLGPEVTAVATRISAELRS